MATIRAVSECRTESVAQALDDLTRLLEAAEAAMPPEQRVKPPPARPARVLSLWHVDPDTGLPVCDWSME
jgi:hypothetical protein